MSRFYNHLILHERRKISFWREQKVLVNEIAKRLGRHRSTIFREIRRNTFFCEEDKTLKGYFHLNAQEFYCRRRQKNQKIETMIGLKEFIIEKLKSDWSPEQIAAYLKHIADRGLYACHETIYRYIYSAEDKRLNPLSIQKAQKSSSQPYP